MSPLEKYLSVYNIVKKYKPYQESKNNLRQARKINYILNNEYMVCVGYSSLLIELLQRIGIEASEYHTKIYEFIDNDLKPRGGHSRTIINLKDEKYNINGYFISDPTWDNHKNIGDTYHYALRPFDSMQNSTTAFELKNLDFILDIHNFEEFVQKINILLDKLTKNEENYELAILNAYHNIFNIIINFFKETDLFMYNNLIHYIKINPNNRTKRFYELFLTEVGHYIVSKSNQDISITTIATAASVAKFYNENVPNALKEAYTEFIIKEYNNYNAKKFFKWESNQKSII